MGVFLLIIGLLFFLSCEGQRIKEPRIAVFISGEGRMGKVKGFLDGLRDLGLKEVKVELYKGNNTLSKMREIAHELALKQEDYDLIAVGGSLEAYMIKSASGKLKTPVVLLGGTSIRQWGLTKDLSRPSEKITGVDNLNAELMEKRIELFSKMFPQIKKVIVFCNPQFEASKNATRITIRAGRKFGIKVVALTVKDVKELEYIISHMREDGFDAIVITPCFYTENFLTSYILHYANFYKVPVFCHAPEFAKKGCPVAYGTSAFEQGYAAANVAYKILKGIPVENVPFVRVYSPKFIINLSALKELYIYYNKRTLVYADEVVK